MMTKLQKLLKHSTTKWLITERLSLTKLVHEKNVHNEVEMIDVVAVGEDSDAMVNDQVEEDDSVIQEAVPTEEVDINTL
jgi:hypothetical protein